MLVYAVGAAHPYREPCRSILERHGEGALAAELTVMVVSEFAHQRLRQTGDRTAAARSARLVAAAFKVHPASGQDLASALALYETADALDAFDALLAATALGRGIDAIVSADRAFDEVDGIERIDPLDTSAIDALASADR